MCSVEPDAIAISRAQDRARGNLSDQGAPTTTVSNTAPVRVRHVGLAARAGRHRTSAVFAPLRSARPSRARRAVAILRSGCPAGKASPGRAPRGPEDRSTTSALLADHRRGGGRPVARARDPTRSRPCRIPVPPRRWPSQRFGPVPSPPRMPTTSRRGAELHRPSTPPTPGPLRRRCSCPRPRGADRTPLRVLASCRLANPPCRNPSCSLPVPARPTETGLSVAGSASGDGWSPRGSSVNQRLHEHELRCEQK